jgi:hypothetical protein
MKELLQIPATIKYIKTMADKSLRLSVDTQELSKEQKTDIFEMHDIFGWFMFTPIELENDIEIPKYEKMEEEDKKTPSQRLRDVLFVLWKQDEDVLKKEYKFFDNYYREKMEVIIEHFKKKIMDF